MLARQWTSLAILAVGFAILSELSPEPFNILMDLISIGLWLVTALYAWRDR